MMLSAWLVLGAYNSKALFSCKDAGPTTNRLAVNSREGLSASSLSEKKLACDSFIELVHALRCTWSHE